MLSIFIIIIIILILSNSKTLDLFNNVTFAEAELQLGKVASNMPTLTNKYDQFKFPHEINGQKYLTFLNDINESFKQKIKNTTELNAERCSGQGSNIELDENTQREILQPVYKKWAQKFPKYFNKTSDALDCVSISDNLCQFTDPNFYLSSDRVYAPPPWTIKSYKDIEYSKQTNLKCFNENLSCCKKSLD